MYKYKNLQAGQPPQEHLSVLQNLLNFIITKHLKQEVDGDLSICMDKCNPCGLCVIGDFAWSKGNGIAASMMKYPVDFYQGVPFNPQIW